MLEQLEARCLLSVNTTTQVAGPNIDVSNLSGYQGETTIAINPTNSLNMIAGSNNLGSGSKRGYTEAYWTTDGGSTWTAVNLGGSGDPAVAFDRNGNAYFAFINSKFGISVRKSTNGGATWAHPVQVAAPPSRGIQDKPAIAVGPDHANVAQDRIYVGWDDNGQGDVVEVSSSGDGGQTWTAPKPVDGVVDEIYAQPAVGPKGEFYIAWDNFATAGQSQIMFSSSLDDGATFTAPVVAATSTINLFNPYRYSIPAQPSRGISADPSMAVEQSGPNAGRIYMTYTTTPSGEHNNSNIELIASDDGGAHWNALGPSPIKVNDDLGTRKSPANKSQFFSAIAIDPTNGTVNLAWYDARNDPNNQKVDVYFQSYSSAGVPSGPNVKVTTAPSDESKFQTNNQNQYGDYMGIAAYGGYAFPVWTDHRDSTVKGSEEIFVDPPLPIPGVADATAPAAESQNTAVSLPSPSGPPASVAVGGDPGGQLVLAATASAKPLVWLAAQAVSSSFAVATSVSLHLVGLPAQAVPMYPDFYLSPPTPARVSRYSGAGSNAAFMIANDPLLPLSARNLGLDATLPLLLPAACDGAVPVAHPQAAAWQQACDAYFGGEYRPETPVDQGPATPPAFPEDPSAALCLIALMAGFALTLNSFERCGPYGSAALMRNGRNKHQR